MEYQQPPHYLRPPPPPHAPPSTSDPYQRPPPPVPPPQSNQPWSYSTNQQFQYQPQTQHSPSPPPPQWGAPPPPYSSEHTQYLPPPPPPPYAAHQPPPYSTHPHYPPPHPLPPRPPPMPQSYGQDWGSGNWSHHQNWDYSTNNTEEDWAAKARAWAAKAVTDNQQPQSQFVPAVRPEDQSHFRDQYSQSSGAQFHEAHLPPPPASMYQQYPGPVQHTSSVQSSHGTDGPSPYATRDGNLNGDSHAAFPQQEKSSISPLSHQQEVPYSYSSVAGNQEAGDRYEKFNSSSSMPVAPVSQHHGQPLHPAGGRSGWMEEPHHMLGGQPVESVPDLSDQPLNFAPHFNRDLDPHSQPNYTSGGPARSVNPVGVSSNYAWGPPSASGVYPPVPPMIPSGPQVDHPIVMPSQGSGHSAPMFPAGTGFQPPTPVIGASFSVGAGTTPHPTAFPGDAYGYPSAERPKKASVPNWLREEIIKNKAVITSSAPDLPKEDSQSVEEDINDKSFRRGDQADSRSIDSSRSTEDEDDDEDEVEAARTAAINQEIKRVLTEVLLKVTDELFDEIATKVLKEDDLSVEVGHETDLSSHRELPSTSAILTPKASAKVLIPTKTKETDLKESSEKSTSGSAGGDILGLGYGSDEEDEGIQSSSKFNSKESSQNPQSSTIKISKSQPAVENGGFRKEMEEQSNVPAKLQTDGTGRKSPVIGTTNHGSVDMESQDNRATRDDELQHGSNNLKSNRSAAEEAGERHARNRSDKTDRHENLKTSSGRDHRDSEIAKEKTDKKGDEGHKRHEERRARSEKTDHYDGSRDKGKEGRARDGKEGAFQTGRDKRTSGKEDNDEKRQDRAKDERKDERKERSRHRNGSDSSRHKRRRSSSVGGRGRESKDNSVVGYANDSSDESSDESKRKSHQSRRRKSPSPVRSRKRQVSRSPHSKHSKRRHSPYSSLEATRGKRSVSRSRSRSPAHRRR